MGPKSSVVWQFPCIKSLRDTSLPETKLTSSFEDPYSIFIDCDPDKQVSDSDSIKSVDSDSESGYRRENDPQK
jgi:hypothetical protein